MPCPRALPKHDLRPSPLLRGRSYASPKVLCLTGRRVATPASSLCCPCPPRAQRPHAVGDGPHDAASHQLCSAHACWQCRVCWLTMLSLHNPLNAHDARYARRGPPLALETRKAATPSRRPPRQPQGVPSGCLARQACAVCRWRTSIGLAGDVGVNSDGRPASVDGVCGSSASGTRRGESGSSLWKTKIDTTGAELRVEADVKAPDRSVAPMFVQTRALCATRLPRHCRKAAPGAQIRPRNLAMSCRSGPAFAK